MGHRRIERSTKFTDFSVILLAVLLLVSIAVVQEKHPHTPIKENTTFDFNEGYPTFTPESIRALSFGYSFAFSSLLWIRFILQTPPKDMGKNQVSWIFLDLHAISIIDPDFIPVYSHGAMYLSVITEDKQGAKILLEKGVAKYPNFWKFRAYLAYHYQYELNEPLQAAEQYRIASTLPGAPDYFSLLAATLYSKSGNSELAKKFIESMIENTRDPNMKKRFQEKIKKLEEKS